MSRIINSRSSSGTWRHHLTRYLFALLLAGLTACGGGGGSGGGDDDDENEGGNNPPVCIINTPAVDVTINPGEGVNYTATVTDPDGDAVTVRWVFQGGTPARSAVEDPGRVVYNADGAYVTTLDATDNSGGTCLTQRRTVTVGNPPVSINSTSQDSLQPVTTPVAQQEADMVARLTEQAEAPGSRTEQRVEELQEYLKP